MMDICNVDHYVMDGFETKWCICYVGYFVKNQFTYKLGVFLPK
jgi:hypothetical protein